MRLCKHEPYILVDWIDDPKYSTDEVLIHVDKVKQNIEHYLIKFRKSTKYPDWFYMSGKMIRRHKTQPNGRGMVYVVPMCKREVFEPIKLCEHEIGG